MQLEAKAALWGNLLGQIHRNCYIFIVLRGSSTKNNILPSPAQLLMKTSGQNFHFAWYHFWSNWLTHWQDMTYGMLSVTCDIFLQSEIVTLQTCLKRTINIYTLLLYPKKSKYNLSLIILFIYEKNPANINNIYFLTIVAWLIRELGRTIFENNNGFLAL